MSVRKKWFLSLFVGGLLLLGQSLSLLPARAAGPSSLGRALASGGASYVFSYGSPYYGSFYGDYYAPYFPMWSMPRGQQPPNYWWVGPYPDSDPRQDGFNPNAGYTWDSVGVLIVEAYPHRARVILDGDYIGTADRLGPIQLPGGEYLLRVEAAGYEPYETTLRVERPGVRELQIRLKASTSTTKANPNM